MDPQDFIPDFSKLTPEQRATAYRHLIGLARVYADATQTRIDDFVVQILEKSTGPVVIGDIQAAFASEDAPSVGIDPATLLTIFQVVQSLLKLFKK